MGMRARAKSYSTISDRYRVVRDHGGFHYEKSDSGSQRERRLSAGAFGHSFEVIQNRRRREKAMSESIQRGVKLFGATVPCA